MAIGDALSILAAVVSAIGGAFAAIAAFRSAGSARAAQHAADEAERRACLRTVATIATEASVEFGRVQRRGAELRSGYQTLEVFSGSYQNSGIRECVDSVLSRIDVLAPDVTHAKLFSENNANLQHAPMTDIDRVHTRLSAALLRVRALREDLEQEHAVLETRLAERRQGMEATRLARDDA